MKRRVVVTGVGLVTPIGIGKEEFWKNLIAGKSGIGLITQFDTEGFDAKIAGEVKDFDFANYGDKKEAKRMDRVTQFAVAAAKMAVDDSKLNIAEIDAVRAGVCVGSGIGGIHTFLDQSLKYGEKGPSRISPFFIPMEIPNMPAGQISIALGFKGPNTAIVTACATGTNCIGDALRTIQYGDADIMIAGGTEAAISPVAVAGFDNMKALSRNNEEPEKASCPFDKKRNGFVMGEGAGVVVLEELEHAKARGAYIYAELIGFGMNADAYHITAPDPSGEMPAACMLQAIKDAGVTPDDVDYVNAHGTSTHRNDLNETLACKKIFGKHAYEVAISSNKSMTGHLLGAAGGVEAIATVMTIANSIIPPTINYEDVDVEEGLDLDYVPNVARKAEVNVAISNNFGFGGHNASIVFKKYKE
ncbi:3-oxoacyl-[acyl-carrier-protein] synthase 2 [bioreactor metagenome]|uniref:3-oxoacyl-[acyl-carrier-protein] synthase 2 n=1 Tax=bioreactor metagenome TaxID=1076179 RepID=A0A644VUX8_9ZZZZ|nr:beta-ketoacyl-ACP synthase II [Acidaminococcaceae bacterium]NLU43499.1 beta-ketoacyl-ACP synthase II [Acholeplasmataceae bacterium]